MFTVLRFRFDCPGKHSELLPGDLAIGEAFIADLLIQAVQTLPFGAIMNSVRLFFSPIDLMYTFYAYVSYYSDVEPTIEEVDEKAFDIELRISQALLQLFWAIVVERVDS